MTTMTIHADDEFAVAMRAYAAKLGKSVNQAVKDVFSPILGLSGRNVAQENPWGRFAGALPSLDCARWESEIEAQRTIDAELWR